MVRKGRWTRLARIIRFIMRSSIVKDPGARPPAASIKNHHGSTEYTEFFDEGLCATAKDLFPKTPCIPCFRGERVLESGRRTTVSGMFAIDHPHSLAPALVELHQRPLDSRRQIAQKNVSPG